MYVKSKEGKVIYIPDTEPNEIKITAEEYPSYVSMKIHEKYSVDDEIAILRQREDKPEEYTEYYAYCEAVKAEAKNLIRGGE